jgi:hypothetical protein
MTAQQYDRPTPRIERPFTTVRAALPAASIAVFDAELQAITEAPVIDLGPWMTCCPTGDASPPGQPPIRPTGSACTKRPASSSPARPAGPTLAEVLGRRGIHLLVYTVRMGSAVAEAPIDDLSDAEVHVLRGAAAHAGQRRDSPPGRQHVCLGLQGHLGDLRPGRPPSERSRCSGKTVSRSESTRSSPRTRIARLLEICRTLRLRGARHRP